MCSIVLCTSILFCADEEKRPAKRDRSPESVSVASKCPRTGSSSGSTEVEHLMAPVADPAAAPGSSAHPAMPAAASSSSPIPAADPKRKLPSLQAMILMPLVKDALRRGDKHFFKSKDTFKNAFNNYYKKMTGFDFAWNKRVLKNIARLYYLHVKDAKSVPQWLNAYKIKVSVQDLIDNDMIPPMKGDSILDLSNKNIYDLSGFTNIPNIKNVKMLLLHNNKLTDIDPSIFFNLTKLRVLSISGNNIPPENESKIKKVIRDMRKNIFIGLPVQESPAFLNLRKGIPKR